MELEFVQGLQTLKKRECADSISIPNNQHFALAKLLKYTHQRDLPSRIQGDAKLELLLAAYNSTCL